MINVRWYRTVPVLLTVLAGIAAAAEVGTVASVAGTASVRRGTNELRATSGTAIARGDELRTGARSRMRVVFQDDSVLTLGENSAVTIDEQVFDPSRGKAKSLMELLRGKVEAVVSEYYQQRGARFEIQTSTAVAGVRGTDFVMMHDADAGITEVVGVSGRVQVHSVLARSGPGVLVTAGQFSSVASGKAPTGPRRMTDNLFRQELEGFNFIGTARTGGLIVNHPIAAGASVPEPDRAGATTQVKAVPVRARHGRDASSLLHQSPPVLEAGQLRVRLF